MSQQTIGTNTNNMLHVKTDTSKIFIWENRYIKATYENPDSDYAAELLAGTVMGRISATQKVVPLASGASDGSEYPIGILAEDYNVDAAGEKEVAICNYGDVVESKLVFDGSDDLDTVVDGRSLRDRIAGDTAGVRLVPSTEMTDFDND